MARQGGVRCRRRRVLLEGRIAGVKQPVALDSENDLSARGGDGRSVMMDGRERAVGGLLCDAVVGMAQGKVRAEGSMSDVTTRREVLDAYLVG